MEMEISFAGIFFIYDPTILFSFFFFNKDEAVVNKYLFSFISFLVSVNYYIIQRKVKQSNDNKYLLQQLNA